VGVGYAMWYDSIHIDVDVSTGCVDLNITSVSGTWAYKCLKTYVPTGEPPFFPPAATKDDIVYTTDVIPAGFEEYFYYVASAKAVNQSVGGTGWLSEWVFFYFANLFPTYVNGTTTPKALVADVLFTYPCTVPAHIVWDDVVQPYDPKTAACEALIPFLKYHWLVKSGETVIYDGADITQVQLHQNYTLYLTIWIEPKDLQDNPQLQSLDCWIRCSDLVVHQWNEAWTGD